MVHFMMEKGAHLQVESLLKSKWSIMHKAAKEGNMELANALVNGGMPLDIESAAGYSPVHIAVLYKRYTVAKFLVEKGDFLF